MNTSSTEMRIEVGESSVGGLLTSPADSTALLVLGHGAGAGMHHAFMNDLAGALAERDIASLRYNFPYTEQGGRRPDAERVLLDTVRAAITAGRDAADGLPVFVGGKSMGGRMASRAMAADPVDAVAGLVFVGFPLHGANKPGMRRAAHLGSIAMPMLFLQGTRDRLADLELMRNVASDLGRLATLHVVDGADHAFSVLKRSGRTGPEVIEELASTVAGWIGGIAGADAD